MSKSLKLFLSIFLFINLFSYYIYPFELYAQDKAKKINELVTKTFENRQFNGSILVAEKGKVIFKKGFGYANMEWKIPNKPDSKFRIGSMTKQFTSMLIMQLVEEGKIQLDAKLTDYLPDYRKDTGDRITIHHLLTHTSGIPRFTSLPGFKSDSIRISYPQDYMVYHYLSGDLLFEPGSKFDYSNAYYLLAVIVEKITGKSYLENLRERVFTPLGMDDSGMEINNEIVDRLTSGYVKNIGGYKKSKYIHMPNALGDGSLYSTVEDLFLWDKALYTEQLLQKKYKNMMFTPFLNHYAYGWKILKVGLSEPTDSVNVIWHSGGLFGFSGIIIRFVEDKHLIVVLLNNTGSFRLSLKSGLCRELTNILYDRYFQLPKKSLAETIGKTILTHDVKTGIKQYYELKSKRQEEFNFIKSELNILGYQLLGNNKTEEAIEIFKLNIQEYPKASNPYDSLGEAYMINGQKELAIKNYIKSLELNPKNTNAKKMLIKLNDSK
jgi:CubicO group peptidase (beta-lactamase class C family)